MMYFKNTIIHHFFVPWIITIAWINLFTGRITTNRDLQKLFINQRKQLKREFYLPDMKAFFVEAKDIISNAVGKPIENLEDCFAFSPREFYAIIDKLSVFSRIYTYIAEAYYLSALAIRELYAEGLAKFPHSVFLEKAKEVFLFELKLGRVIQFEECFTTELVDNSLQYYGQEGVIDSVGATHKTVNIDHLESIIRKYERDLVEPFSFNIRTT